MTSEPKGRTARSLFGQAEQAVTWKGCPLETNIVFPTPEEETPIPQES